MSSMLAAVLADKSDTIKNAEFTSECMQIRVAPDENISGARLPERDTLIGPQAAADLKARRGESMLASSNEHDTTIELTTKGWRCLKHQVSGRTEKHAWSVHEKLVPNDLLPVFDSAHTARTFVVPHIDEYTDLYENFSSSSWHSTLTSVVRRSREHTNNSAEDPDERVILLAKALRAMALHPCTFYPLSAFASFKGGGQLSLSEQEWLHLLCGFGRLWPGSGLLSQEDAESNIHFGVAPDSHVQAISSCELSQLFSVCPFRGVGAGASWAFVLPKADHRVCICGEMLRHAIRLPCA